ncbi:MAG: DUF938 domain-containing protein [Deltaproteobacteria bacterium]|nr:MAG: DUF938 domain-containing protein [Deltaproteobacteria bacterium]
MNLPNSPASERNKEPILEVLKTYTPLGEVLEVGHGTGQHAVYFSEYLQTLWYPADIEQNNWMMAERIKIAASDLIQPPLTFEVGLKPIGEQINRNFDSIFTANTFHIMAERHVFEFCDNLNHLLKPNGKFFLYGPFKFQGQFTSESNEMFDRQLKNNQMEMGIRDFEAIENCLKKIGVVFLNRHDLPANNQLLVFQNES